ncbi:hypothetical protein BKA58DRAFT_374633 [Alternaria rosae]|uniref:uncharacterized protein n=1 Tax=Alternaria rosae TaxID=1187941 RepID=UPI001E8D49D3|nr:uncharacterized protein BKA58DRAFT_374633 [Alternaria rosae]KAH6883177.1 hypothetical protein BKA58DRAFT_374633 [Alternaria rosae]
MPLLQSVPDAKDVDVPRPLRIDRPRSRPQASSPSSSPSWIPSPVAQQQHRRVESPDALRARQYPSPRAQPVPRRQDGEAQNRLRVTNSAVATPSTSASPSPCPKQPRRLELSTPIPSRFNSTPSPILQPVDLPHQDSEHRSSLNTLKIRRRFTSLVSSEPAKPSTPLGNHVSKTTVDTPKPSTSTSSSSTAHSAYPADKTPSSPPPPTITLALPAPLTTTLASPKTSISTTPPPPPKPRHRTPTQLTRSLKNKLKKPLAALSLLTNRRSTPGTTTVSRVASATQSWLCTATAMSRTGGGFGIAFESSTRTALGEVLEENGYVGRRVDSPVGERDGGEGEDEEDEETVVQRAVLLERFALLNLDAGRRKGDYFYG